MREALNMLTELIDVDLDWICSRAHERHYPASTCLIAEGTRPEALYFVLEGLLKVEMAASGERTIATLGPGELVGDIAFLEGGRASATVTAGESSLVLAIPVALLAKRLLMDTAFAARFYRSIALIATRRLQARIGHLGTLLTQMPSLRFGVDSPEANLEQATQDFLASLRSAEKRALKHGGGLEQQVDNTFTSRFEDFCAAMHNAIGDSATTSPGVKDELGLRVQRQILPWFLMSEAAERAYAKPRGYAGDHLTIETIHRNQPKGHGRLGTALDQAFLATPLCKGIRSRSAGLAEVLQRYLKTQKSGPVKVTSLGCGSAREMFEVFSRISDLKQVNFTLLDIDPEALRFVKSELDRLGFQNQVRLEHVNLVYLALGRHHLDLRNQDLVYSLGLVDSFDDRLLRRLLGYMHQVLRPSGKAILGSVRRSDMSKTFMDYVISWRLIHRDKEEMSNLFSESAFGHPCRTIGVENDDIAFLAEGTKE